MTKIIIGLLMIIVAATAALSPSIFAQEAELFDEDAPRLTEEQRRQITLLNEEFQAITDPIAKRDRRYPQYAADLEELKTITDERLLAEKVAAFRTGYGDFIGEILRLAGITERDYNLRLQQILPHLRLDENGRIINEGSEPTRTKLNQPKPAVFRKEPFFLLNARDETFETTDFSEKWSIADCYQAKVTFPTSKEFQVNASTQSSKPDCSDVKAARGTTINVPAGVKKVRVEIFLAKYGLFTDASVWTIFGYANAYSAVGIRVRGLIAGSAKLTNYFRHKYRDTSWSVFGFDSQSVTETDARMICSFIPVTAGDYQIQAYGRITVDTDGIAHALSSSHVEGLQKMKITFFR